MVRVKLHFENGCIFPALINAFFSKEEFNPKNSIFIKGDTAELTLFFDDVPPRNIISVISACNVEEFVFEGSENEANTTNANLESSKINVSVGSELYRVIADAVIAENKEARKNAEAISESSNEDNSVIVDSQSPNEDVEIIPEKSEVIEETNSTNTVQEESAITSQPEAQVDDKGTEVIKTKRKYNISAKRHVEFSELDKIAEMALSPKEFGKAVGKWLELEGKEKNLYSMLIRYLPKKFLNHTKIDWKLLNTIVNEKGFKQYHLICLRKKINVKTGGMMPEFFNHFLQLYVCDRKSDTNNSSTKEKKDA